MIAVAVLLIILLVIVFIIMMSIINDNMLSIDELARVSGLLDASEESEILLQKKFDTALDLFQAEISRKNQEMVETRAIINELKKFLENGVFYDRNNDTIVIVKELERIGDL